MIQIRGCAHTIPRMHLDAYWPLESKHLPSILKSHESATTPFTFQDYTTHTLSIYRETCTDIESCWKIFYFFGTSSAAGGILLGRGPQIMVNLIPYNPTAASTTTGGFQAPAHQRVERLLDEKF